MRTLPPSDRAGRPAPGRHVVVLHIGAMKTGTTYLQGKAFANRDALLAAGVHMPGERWSEQVWGVQELLGMGRTDPELVRRNAGRWQQIAEEMRTAPQPTSLLTMEFLAFADREQARRAIESFPGCEVRVVLTVRDTAAVVPALWQTTVTSGGTMKWPRFRSWFRAAIGGHGAGAKVLSALRVPTAVRFQEALNIVRMLRVWTSVLPPEQVHVVVVPGPDAPRERLWQLFSEAVGVDPTVAPEEGDNPNESLGYPSAELVRRVNAAIDIEHMRFQTVVKDDLGHNTLGRRRGIERRARLDAATLRAALRWNACVRRAIESTGATVHGDPDDLPTAPRAQHTVEERHAAPTDLELLAAARPGLGRLTRLVRRRSRRLMEPDEAKRFRERLAARALGADDWGSAADPVAAAVADLVLYADGLIALRKRREQLRRERERSGAGTGRKSRKS